MWGLHLKMFRIAQKFTLSSRIAYMFVFFFKDFKAKRSSLVIWNLFLGCLEYQKSVTSNLIS